MQPQQGWFNFLWLDFVGVALGLYAINAGLTGELKTYGRPGRPSTWGHLRTTWSRIAMSLSGLIVLALVTVDLRHKFHP